MLAFCAADLWELVFEQTGKGKEMVCFLVASSRAEAGVDRIGTQVSVNFTTFKQADSGLVLLPQDKPVDT